MKEVKANVTGHIVVYLIGNRADLEDEREVRKERAEKFAKENGI